MGKIRTRILGLENLEMEQKEEQKKRSAEKKLKKQAEKDDIVEETAVDETETKSAKKAKKQEEVAPVKKHVQGKKYQEASKKLDKNKSYTLADAIKTLKEIKFAKFDESVELHLNVDKEGLKGEVELPHSTGKTVRVKIVDDKVLEALEQGVIDFDVLVTHPSFMPKLAKFARVLGPKGLMPNPKAGTVSPQPEEVAKKFQKGTLRWKTEAKFPLIHQMIAKISADDSMIVENAQAFVASVGKNVIKAATIKTTMSPGLKLDVEKI